MSSLYVKKLPIKNGLEPVKSINLILTSEVKTFTFRVKILRNICPFMTTKISNKKVISIFLSQTLVTDIIWEYSGILEYEIYRINHR